MVCYCISQSLALNTSRKVHEDKKKNAVTTTKADAALFATPVHHSPFSIQIEHYFNDSIQTGHQTLVGSKKGPDNRTQLTQIKYQ